MKRILYLLLIIYLPFSVNAQQTQKVYVAAAANLSGVIREVKEDFEKENDDIKIYLILGSSGKLSSQIINGADFDLFLSADMNFAEQLFNKELTVNKPEVYAKGKLILFSKNNIDFSKGLSILKYNGVKNIAIANPTLAPYGRAVVETIEKSGLKDIESKFVYSENISQTAEQALVAADAAFLAKSLLYTYSMEKYNKEDKYWIAIDDTLYDYILSSHAREIFSKYGYE